MIFAGLTVRATEDRFLAPIFRFGTIQEPEQGYWHVAVIALNFVPYGGSTMPTLAAMAQYDWEGIDEYASSLPVLRHVIVGLGSQKELVFFAKEIEPKLQRLRVSDRVKYALRYYDQPALPTSGWVACEPSDADEGAIHLFV